MTSNLVLRRRPRIGWGQEVATVAVIPLYRDVVRALGAAPAGAPVWPRFEAEVCRRYPAYFAGLAETYGETFFGPGGLPGAVEGAATALLQSLRSAEAFGMEEQVRYWLDTAAPLLPLAGAPDLYLGTLFYTAPAATLGVGGRPAIALGMERFHPAPPETGTKYWYRPAEAAEMIPHEAAHVARMQALGLPPTPRRLSLLDMVMLEGTALTFTDLLLGRRTLATFLPADRLAWHQANDGAIRAAAAADFGRVGMDVFKKYFSADSQISGYYVGWSLCDQWLRKYGSGHTKSMVALPSQTILLTA